MHGRRWTALAVGVVVALGAAGCSGPAADGGPTRTTPTGTTPTGTGTPVAGSGGAGGRGTTAAAGRALAALERRHDARLGVVVAGDPSDTGDPSDAAAPLRYRADERFPFASTNKVFIAAAVLDRSTPAELDTVVHYDRGDLLAYAPVASAAVDRGLTVGELVDAALRFSDNTAANLLVERLGGPAAVQRWLRGIGDRVTRVDRLEPDLNAATPGDVRDTTTPEQFAEDLRAVLLGDVLDADDRRLLRDTMLRNTTGDDTIRAGVPDGWAVADKTGTGSYGVRADIALVTPPGGTPSVVVVMTRSDAADAEPSDALVAAATRVAFAR